MNRQIKKIATHFSTMHSDELTAIALLKVFKSEFEYQVDRLPHQTEQETLDKYDYVIDIGRKYDGVKYFDHHQNNPKEDDRASAGLIWDYLDTDCVEYLDIEAFIKQVDANDLGLKEPNSHSIISLVRSMNLQNHNSEEQNDRFNLMLDVITKYIQSIKDLSDERSIAADKLKHSETIDIDGSKVVISNNGFIKEWQYHLSRTDADFFMWYDVYTKTWKVQAVPVEYGSFKFKKPLEPSKQNNKVEFVHNGKFFAVGSRKGLLKLVEDSKE